MWWRWENDRNVAVVVYSLTIYEAVLKKKLSGGSMWDRCRVDVVVDEKIYRINEEEEEELRENNKIVEEGIKN